MQHQRISDDTVKAKTGKSLRDWIALLDEQGAKQWPHKRVADWLIEQQNVPGWWAQTVTVEYEYHHSKRVVGQTKDAGFQIGVQRTLPVDAGELWDFLVSPTGVKLWLGVAAVLPLEKGATMTAGDWGIEVRSVAEESKLRLRLTSADRPASTLQLYLMSTSPDKTSLLFHHEKLIDAKDRQRMKAHWQEVLEQIRAYTTPQA